MFENKEAWRVLKDSESWSKQADHSGSFGPEPTLVRSTAHLSESRCRLARHASCKDINPANLVSSDGFDVAKVSHGGEVLIIDKAFVGVDFGVSDGAESFSFKGEAEASNSGK